MTDTSQSCCAASRRDASITVNSADSPVDAVDALPSATKSDVAPEVLVAARIIELPGGQFLMGSEDSDINPGDAESPVRMQSVEPFAIAAHTVTNTQFAEFVAAAGYVTDAERFGWSYVFASFLTRELRKASPRPQGTPWWCAVKGATWRSPEGPGTDAVGRQNHPVVHVSWADAEAYATWAGGRLPTEVEWEYAARGGLSQARLPWGDELTPDGEHRCNIWQGMFPTRNTQEDGFAGTCPVDAFEPNGFGLFNVAGNVWEMCADLWRTEVQPGALALPASETPRVMRGGSYLCHASYCNRYRVAARTGNTADSSSGNLGFRVVYSATSDS